MLGCDTTTCFLLSAAYDLVLSLSSPGSGPFQNGRVSSPWNTVGTSEMMGGWVDDSPEKMEDFGRLSLTLIDPQYFLFL